MDLVLRTKKPSGLCFEDLKPKTPKRLEKNVDYSRSKKKSYSPFFGHPEDMGLMGSDLSFFCSELFARFSEVIFRASKQRVNIDE